MNIIKIVKNNAMAMVAGIAIIGFNSFKVLDATSDAKQSDVVFTYQPPSGSSTPYADANVKNTANWQRSSNDCSSSADQEVACSIAVPSANNNE